MKICIELDEEMQKIWNDAKESLEEEFSRQNDTSISFTESEVFGGILAGWPAAEYTTTPMFYVWALSDEEVEKMKTRESRNSG